MPTPPDDNANDLPSWADFDDGPDHAAAQPDWLGSQPRPESPGPASEYQGTPPASAPASPWFSDAGPARPKPNRRRPMIIAAAAVAAVAVIGGVIAVAASSGGGASDKPAGATPPTIVVTAPPSTTGAELCPNTINGPVTTGNDAGGTSNGPQVIKAFDYGYYTRRNAAAAREVVAANAAINPTDVIQNAINQVPAGTTYCLTITDRGAGTWGVVLSVYEPGAAAPTVIRQQVETTDSGGRTWINSIVDDPRK